VMICFIAKVYSCSEVLSMSNICENTKYSSARSNSSPKLVPGSSLPLLAEARKLRVVEMIAT
jgi:hypothetical protein